MVASRGRVRAMARRLVWMLLAAAVVIPSLGRTAAAARPGAHANAVGAPLVWLDAHRPRTGTAWVLHHLLENHKVSIEPRAVTATLERFYRPWLSGLPDAAWFERGRFGPRSWQTHPPLSWNENACDQEEPAAGAWSYPAYSVSLAGGLKRPESARLVHAWLSMASIPEPELLQLTTARGCPAYQIAPQVTVIRTSGEYDRFRLLECDGSVSSDALDRLSVLMRPPGVPRPELPLPAEPPANEH